MGHQSPPVPVGGTGSQHDPFCRNKQRIYAATPAPQPGDAALTTDVLATPALSDPLAVDAGPAPDDSGLLTVADTAAPAGAADPGTAVADPGLAGDPGTAV